jgi:hypothetical protein
VRFRERCREVAEETSDAELAKLRDRFQTKIDRVSEQMATAHARYQEADAIAAAKSEENLFGTAGDLLGAFLGGKSRSNPLKRAANRRTATAKAQAKADTEAAKYQAKHQELAELEDELAAEVNDIVSRYEALAGNIESVDIRLEKSDVRVADLKLVWVPVE